MGDIVHLDMITRFDIDPERVISALKEADLEGVVVLGYTKGDDEYFASSYASGADVLWLLERLKLQLLSTEGE